MMVSLRNALASLSRKRPVFHSEADFQHALAWEVHERSPTYAIRLEYPIESQDGRIHVDIYAFAGDLAFAIELKYKTGGLAIAQKRESFVLKNQAAQDLGRYDFLRDLWRLEQVVASSTGGAGFAVFLTNDSAYWKLPRSRNTVDSPFRIHEGRIVSGHLSWERRASAGTTRGREAPIVLAGTYALSWADYSQPSRDTYGRFRYLLVEVGP